MNPDGGELEYGTSQLTAQDVLDRILCGQKAFREYNDFCDQIDAVYSRSKYLTNALAVTGFTDRDYDLFWSSIEVLKPAIYSKTPQVIARPRYSDANATDKMAAELIERVVNSEFERNHIHEDLLLVRDDLALMNRGVLWATLCDDGDEQSIVNEWIDREDFVHDPVRAWRDNGMAARRCWMTMDEFKDRFDNWEDFVGRIFFGLSPNSDNGIDGISSFDPNETPDKAAIWEVWLKHENRVVWVASGCDEFIDEDDPYIKLADFFPCPKPAYGTLIRRSLVPQPDYVRYAPHLNQINILTKRIYDLLDRVRAIGFFAGGGDVGTAVQASMDQLDETSGMLIPIPGAALTASGGAANAISWLPMDVIANTITGLIEARAQLFADFDRLSGISDIMRGETEASETLGAQRLKGQYGSVRVKDKCNEIIRVARDAARITAEIICENYSQKELLHIAQMDIPTRSEVDKKIKELEKSARDEMMSLTEDMPEDPSQIPPEQAEQMQAQLQEAQKQIEHKYAPLFQQLASAVVIEDVMKLIKDERGRSLIIDVETDSTVMTDEMAERQTRAEFMGAFSGALAATQPLMAAGEKAAKLAGAVFKFGLGGFGTNRELEAALDEFIESAPEIAQNLSEQSGEGEGMAEASAKLAEAEMAKAQAQMAKVEADTQLKQVEMQGKMQEMQMKASNDQNKLMLDAEKLKIQLEKQNGDLATQVDLINAQVEKTRAETAKILASIQVDHEKLGLEEYKVAVAQEDKQIDRAINVENRAMDDEFRARGEDRSDRQQGLGEQQAFEGGQE